METDIETTILKHNEKWNIHHEIETLENREVCFAKCFQVWESPTPIKMPTPTPAPDFYFWYFLPHFRVVAPRGQRFAQIILYEQIDFPWNSLIC